MHARAQWLCLSVLCYCWQLVVSVSATRRVDEFSIRVYEAASERALLLSDWPLFLSHICGLLNEQYPNYRGSTPAVNGTGAFPDNW